MRIHHVKHFGTINRVKHLGTYVSPRDEDEIRKLCQEVGSPAIECPNCGKHALVQVNDNKQACLVCTYAKAQLTGQALEAVQWLKFHVSKPSLPCIPRLPFVPSDCFAVLVEIYCRERSKKVSHKELFYRLIIEYAFLMQGIIQSKIDNLWLPSGNRHQTDD